MKRNKIKSEKDLLDTFRKNTDNVVSCLSETPSDLELLEDKINSMGISFVLYCPLPPYNHDYNIIDEFIAKVEQDRKGKLIKLTTHT